MKRLLTTAILCVCAAVGAFAQTPNYALADQFSAKKVSSMVFSTSVTPNWFRDSDKFWYSWRTSQGTKYYIVDPVAKTKKEVFDMEKLARQITEIILDPFDAQHLPLTNMKLVDDKYFTFEVQSTLPETKKEKGDKNVKPEDDPQMRPGAGAPSGKGRKKVFKFEYEIATGKLSDISDKEDEEKDYPRWANISPDRKFAVYTKNNNLWYMEMSELEKLKVNEKDSTVVEHRLTSDGIENFSYGGGYGSSKDTTARGMARVIWSPNGHYFATQRSDQRMIKDLWVINTLSEPRPTLETYKYQMPGEPGAKTYVYLCDMSASKPALKQIKVDAFKDQTVSIMSAPRKNTDTYEKERKSLWLGTDRKFYIERTSRDLKRVDICTVDVTADSAVVVIPERLNTYVETQTLKFIGKPGESDMVHWSERNGWANIYLYSHDGNLKRNINDASYHVSEILFADAKGVVFTASGVNKDENPYYNHVYRLPLTGGTPVRIDEAGYHTSAASISDDGKFFVSNYSRVDATPRASLYNAAGTKVMDLEEADLSLLFAAGYKFPEQFKVKAADGVTDLWGVMYKPFDFDSTKTYPIIDYVYPGPQVEGNNIAWTSNMTRVDRLAQVGFIVVTVGNRGGHPDRSKWYHNYGYGNLRDYGLADQKYAIQQLAARNKFVDIDRVGIHGHSGGGFMSTAAILTYPDFFKVAVSCAGNHDNRIYNRWWSEQHHGIEEVVGPQGDTTFNYSINFNQELAKNLKGHLMLVHGDVDNNVHPGNTIRVVDALIKANKRFDMLILPGQRHSFGDMNEYFFWRMADYYSEWLLGESKRSEVDVRELNNDK